MNNNCVVTLMRSDSKQFVNGLVSSLREEYDSVSFLALGTSNDVEVLESKFESVMTLLDLGPDFNACQLIVTSLAASIEISTHIGRFSEALFWFDPELENSQGQSEFFALSAASSLASVSSKSIVAKTEDGKELWNTDAAKVESVVPAYFSTPDLSENAEPLIEKKSRLRILIDGSSNINNHYLVNPFVVLEQRDDLEIWCLFDGELKSWMRPDFQISAIKPTEMDIYCNSVDAVVLVGSNVTKKMIADYVAVGVVPIAIDENVNEVMAELDGYAELAQEYPEIGTEELLNRLLPTQAESRLSDYNSLASGLDTTDTYFTFTSVKNMFSNTSSAEEHFSTPAFSRIYDEYMIQQYGDVKGSLFHQHIQVNSRIVAKLEMQPIQEIRVSGWALDKSAKLVCNPILWSASNKFATVTRRHNRQDVDEYLDLNGMPDLGFVTKAFEFEKDVNTDEIKYAISDNAVGCVQANTIVEGLDLFINQEELDDINTTLLSESEVQGCIETLTFVDAGRFDLRVFKENLNELEFRLRMADEYVDLSRVEVYLKAGEKIQRLSSSNSSGVITIPEIESIATNLEILLSSESIELEEVTLVVSNSDDVKASNNVVYMIKKPETDSEDELVDSDSSDNKPKDLNVA